MREEQPEKQGRTPMRGYHAPSASHNHPGASRPDQGEQHEIPEDVGLALVAASALMAFVGAGTASATTLDCEGIHCSVGTTVDFSLASSAILETTGGTTLVTCTGGTVHGRTKNTGSANETVTGDIEALSWSGCTKETKTLIEGELEIHHIPTSPNGTVTAKNTQVTVAGLFNNESCIYGAGTGIDLGVFTGGTGTSLAINTLVARQPGSGPFCPAEARWTASYKLTAPKTLTVTAG